MCIFPLRPLWHFVRFAHILMMFLTALPYTHSTTNHVGQSSTEHHDTRKQMNCARCYGGKTRHLAAILCRSCVAGHSTCFQARNSERLFGPVRILIPWDLDQIQHEGSFTYLYTQEWIQPSRGSGCSHPHFLLWGESKKCTAIDWNMLSFWSPG